MIKHYSDKEYFVPVMVKNYNYRSELCELIKEYKFTPFPFEHFPDLKEQIKFSRSKIVILDLEIKNDLNEKNGGMKHRINNKCYWFFIDLKNHAEYTRDLLSKDRYYFIDCMKFLINTNRFLVSKMVK